MGTILHHNGGASTSSSSSSSSSMSNNSNKHRPRSFCLRNGVIVVLVFVLVSLQLSSRFSRMTYVTTSMLLNHYYFEKQAALLPSVSTLEMVWLMSFPNSGTTYTISNVEHTSNMTTATNYANELVGKKLIPLYEGGIKSGPYIYSPDKQVPTMVLTKTHCEGYCDFCQAKQSILSLDQFETGCRSGYNREENGDNEKDNEDSNNYMKTLYYHRPSRAVHIFRHPLDNIVARMHRGIGKRKAQGWSPQKLAQFGDSKKGFLNWCALIDARFEKFTQVYPHITPLQKDLIRQLPCYSDLFRYVQWHNLAIQATKKYGIAVHYMYYEDYSTSFDKTVNELNKFLRLPQVHSSLPFQTGKTYEHLFDVRQQEAAAKLIKEWATNECWVYLRNYASDWLKQQPQQQPEKEMLQLASSSSSSSSSQLMMNLNGPALQHHQQKQEHGQVEHALTTKDGEQGNIVWLMSFPNSGTSFTITNTWIVTNASTASNYAAEAFYLSKRLVPVRKELPAGPFLLYPRWQVPKYVLTKTHCTGFCDGCNALNTLLSLSDFSEACRTTSYGSRPNMTRTAQPYSPVKAVHLFRHPIDNIVARKHLGVKQRLESGEFKDAAQYDDSRQGVLNWCRYVDGKFEDEEQGQAVAIFTTEMKERMKQVPCYSEWFRYIQWHNLATKTISQLGVPSLNMYYEDYTSRFDDVVQELVDFLELPRVKEPREFIPGKTYLDFFKLKDVKAAAHMARYAATPEAWKLVKHYFNEDLYPAEKSEVNDEDDNDEDDDDGDDDEEESESEDTEKAIRVARRERLKARARKTDANDEASQLSNGPQVALLMSFPNSGTSYTIRHFEESTNKSSATNIGSEVEGKELKGIRPDLPSGGPFWHHPHMELPQLVLTKTHCSGYCDYCTYNQSKKSDLQYEAGCLAARKEVGNETVKQRYQPALVKKAVHLFRSPFDNIVARMHLGVKKRRATWPAESLSKWKWNDTQAGMLSWCEYVDEMFDSDLDPSGSGFENTHYFKSVPCHSEWFRYTQWHNHAIKMLKRYNISTHVVYYEDYSFKFNETIDTLMSFLEIKMVNKPRDFVAGKTYEDLFSFELLLETANLVRSLATPECWSLIRRYFTKYFDTNVKQVEIAQ